MKPGLYRCTSIRTDWSTPVHAPRVSDHRCGAAIQFYTLFHFLFSFRLNVLWCQIPEFLVAKRFLCIFEQKKQMYESNTSAD